MTHTCAHPCRRGFVRCLGLVFVVGVGLAEGRSDPDPWHLLREHFLITGPIAQGHSQGAPKLRLLGVGAHRTVQYTLPEGQPGGDDSPSTSTSCRRFLVQPLPPDVYMDPFELEALSRRHPSFPTLTVLGPVDLELPSAACQPTVFVAALDVTLTAPNASTPQPQRMHTFAVPLHAKYPPPIPPSSSYRVPPSDSPTLWSVWWWRRKARGSAPSLYAVTLPEPMLLVGCSSEAGLLDTRLDGERTAGREPQEWTLLSSASAVEPVVWAVPAGRLDHGRAVGLLTLLAVSVCAAFIVHSALQTLPCSS